MQITASIKKLSVFLISFFIINNIFAQNTLPDITVSTEKGINIISWQNPYKSGIRAIVVERSVDSNFNYGAIGIVKNFNNSIQSFIDVTPLAGNNWYRVKVIFESEIEWLSNNAKVRLDSTDIENRIVITSVDTLQKRVNDAIIENHKKTIENAKKDSLNKEDALITHQASLIPNNQPSEEPKNDLVQKKEPSVAKKDSLVSKQEPPAIKKEAPINNTATPPKQPETVKSTDLNIDKIVETVIEKTVETKKAAPITKSKYIYTNPYSGNVNIELPDVRVYNYKIVFYNTTNNKKIFEIPRIHEEVIILDKRNFQNVGSYKFIITRDDLEFEQGTISIY